MKLADLAAMCAQNLRRRRARTLLTALGVLVGCCAIVIMVSIGCGLQEETERTLAQMGDLTVVTVSSSGSSETGATKLDDTLVEQIESLDGVAAVSPKLESYSLSVQLSAEDGRYTTSYATLVGMDASALDSVGYAAASGEQLSPESGSVGTAGTTGTIDVLVGQYFAYSFLDSYRSEGSNYVDRYANVSWDEDGNEVETGETPAAFFDPLEEDVRLDVLDSNGNVVASYTLHPVGTLEEDWSRGSETSDGVVMSLADMKAILAAAAQAGASADSSDVSDGSGYAADVVTATGSSGSKSTTYSSILVKCSSLDTVEGVEEAIQAMGVSTYSMESVRKPMEEQAFQQQLMLGGMGAISLFVAALGIANTMVMSITERTREIGVMKALGCYRRDVRRLFLAEAGAIGLIGGVAGCLLSCVISVVMNLVSSGDMSWAGVQAALFGGEAARMSIIPAWLYLFALGFSVLVGLLSGLYPANRAVRIPAIEAIRSE